MAIDISQDEITVDVEQTEQGQELIKFPSDPGEETRFEEYLAFNGERHGVATLRTAWKNYKSLAQRADNWKQTIEQKLNRINGVPSETHALAGKKRSLKAAAKKMYAVMTDKELRTACESVGLDYYSYESVEDIEKALVDKFVETHAK